MRFLAHVLEALTPLSDRSQHPRSLGGTEHEPCAVVVFLARPEQGAGEVGLGRGSSVSVTGSAHRRARRHHEGMAASPSA